MKGKSVITEITRSIEKSSYLWRWKVVIPYNSLDGLWNEIDSVLCIIKFLHIISIIGLSLKYEAHAS